MNNSGLRANPTKGKGERNIYCPIDGECVDYAARERWSRFNCEKCELRNVSNGEMPENINRKIIGVRSEKILDSRLRGNDGQGDVMERMKVCKKCGQEKPLNEFHNAKKSKDGLKAECKDCVSIYMRNFNARKQDSKALKKQKKKPVETVEIIVAGDNDAVSVPVVSDVIDNSEIYKTAAAAFIGRIERKMVESIVEGLKVQTGIADS